MSAKGLESLNAIKLRGGDGGDLLAARKYAKSMQKEL